MERPVHGDSIPTISGDNWPELCRNDITALTESRPLSRIIGESRLDPRRVIGRNRPARLPSALERLPRTSWPLQASRQGHTGYMLFGCKTIRRIRRPTATFWCQSEIDLHIRARSPMARAPGLAMGKRFAHAAVSGSPVRVWSNRLATGAIHRWRSCHR